VFQQVVALAQSVAVAMLTLIAVVG